MAPPFTFDPSGEREDANVLLAAGVTQSNLASAQVSARGDKSKGLIVLGGAPASMNPLNLSTPLPNFQQSGAANPATPDPGVPAPSRGDPMHVSAAPNYQQPGTANPAPLPAGVVSRSNPMGL